MTVEFPFAEVTEIEKVFGGISNYDEVLQAVPQDLGDEGSLFLSAAQKWFDGSFNPELDLAGYAPVTDSLEEAMQQRDYIQTWANTYRPKHQDKIAVMGWLLSIAFRRVE